MKPKEIIPPFFLLGVKDFQASRELKLALKDFPVGGLVLFNSPHDSPHSIWKDRDVALEIIYNFMREIESPLLAVDQEGGRVRRLRAPFVEMPSAAFMSRVAAEKGMDSVRKIYSLAAEQMSLTKINVNFAPVCDLTYADAHATVMGDRCYSSERKTTARLASLFCEAFAAHGIHCVLKHYPGHGPSRFDSHERTALLFKTKREMEKEDSQVFHDVADKALGLMTAHIAFEDEPERIFSLDSEWILEAKARFGPQPFWFTDDLLTMKAVNSSQPWLRCLELNYDYLLLCDGLEKSIPALEESIRWGETRDLEFAEELKIEKRIKTHELRLRRSFSLLPYKVWKQRIIELYNESHEILSVLREELA